jgi:hypothetical protein
MECTPRFQLRLALARPAVNIFGTHIEAIIHFSALARHVSTNFNCERSDQSDFAVEIRLLLRMELQGDAANRSDALQHLQ